MTKASLPRVGFVVIGRNEGERLSRCLESLLGEGDQIVYVDSGSTDGSVQLARNHHVIVCELDASAPYTAARGRNVGFEEIRNRFSCDYVQFIDGDCILEPGWVGAATSHLDANGKTAVVCGRRREEHPGASLYNRQMDDEWNTPIGRADHCGGDAMVRICALEQVGGFRPELRAGEEPEMSSRLRALGWEIWRIDAPMTIHDARIYRLNQWWKRSVRGGYGYAEVWSITGQLPRRVFSDQLRRAFLWALAIPGFVCVGAVALGELKVLLAVPAIYGLQVFRVAARRGLSLTSIQSAALIMLAKVPEAIGALSYFLGRKSNQLSDYKAIAR